MCKPNELHNLINMCLIMYIYWILIKSLILSSSLSLKLSSSLARLTNHFQTFWQAWVWTLVVGLVQAWAKLEHFIVIVEPSLNIQYMTKFGSFITLRKICLNMVIIRVINELSRVEYWKFRLVHLLTWAKTWVHH